MDIEIRLINDNEFDKAFELIGKTFDKFVAPYYTEEGLKCFREQYFNHEEMLKKYNSPKWEFVGAFDNGKLIGILSGKKKYIEMFFIDEEYQHMGVGKKLFNYFISDKEEDVGLYASHDAVSFYEGLGFVKLTEERSENGMLTTPMIYRTKEIVNDSTIMKH